MARTQYPMQLGQFVDSGQSSRPRFPMLPSPGPQSSPNMSYATDQTLPAPLSNNGVQRVSANRRAPITSPQMPSQSGPSPMLNPGRQQNIINAFAASRAAQHPIMSEPTGRYQTLSAPGVAPRTVQQRAPIITDAQRQDYADRQTLRGNLISMGGGGSPTLYQDQELAGTYPGMARAETNLTNAQAQNVGNDAKAHQQEIQNLHKQYGDQLNAIKTELATYKAQIAANQGQGRIDTANTREKRMGSQFETNTDLKNKALAQRGATTQQSHDDRVSAQKQRANQFNIGQQNRQQDAAQGVGAGLAKWLMENHPDFTGKDPSLAMAAADKMVAGLHGQPAAQVTQPNGGTVHAATGTKLPDGWSDAGGDTVQDGTGKKYKVVKRPDGALDAVPIQ